MTYHLKLCSHILQSTQEDVYETIHEIVKSTSQQMDYLTVNILIYIDRVIYQWNLRASLVAHRHVHWEKEYVWIRMS